MSQQNAEQDQTLPDPAEMAKTYAEVAQRASRIITHFMEKKVKEGIPPPMTNWAWPEPSWTCRPACWPTPTSWPRPR